jgi:hypothetical protein
MSKNLDSLKFSTLRTPPKNISDCSILIPTNVVSRAYYFSWIKNKLT